MTEEEEFEFRHRLEQEQGFSQEQAPAPPQAEGPGLFDQVTRQVGLTARAAGPVGVGAAAGAAMGAPILGVGAVPGAMAGAGAMGILQLLDRMAGTNYVESVMDRMGLPKPEGGTEKIVSGATEAMTGMAGLGGAASTVLRNLGPTSKSVGAPIARMLADRPGQAAISAAAAGGAGSSVKEAGGGPLEQFGASMAAGIAAPGTVATGQRLGGVAGDVVATIKAALGNQKAVEKIAKDAIDALTKSNPRAIAEALAQSKTSIKGAKPTVAEAIAERNLQHPGEQVGGAIIKTQAELYGAKQIEDLLPSVARGQEVAVKEYLKRLNNLTDPIREAALAQARTGPTYGFRVIRDIEQLVANPEYSGSTIAMRVLNSTKNKIRRLSDQKGPTIAEVTQQGVATIHKPVDPAALYTIRKELGNTISGFIKLGQKWDKKMTAGLTRDIQRSIDDAIEAAGATGWKRYLAIYRRGITPVTRRTARLEKVSEIAAEVSPRPTSEVARSELPTLPTLLHRPMMAVNFALKLIAKDATEPVVRELAKRMADPKGFLELMRRPINAPAREAAKNILARAAILVNLIEQHQQDSQEE